MRTAASGSAPPRDTIRVVLADDHQVVRAGLRALLHGCGDIDVVGEAANGREALLLVERLRPDVTVLDVDMPLLDGIAATSTLVARDPATRVLILSVYAAADYPAEARGAGAAGYLVKHAAPRDLAPAIRAVASGATYFDQSRTGAARGEPARAGVPLVE